MSEDHAGFAETPTRNAAHDHIEHGIDAAERGDLETALEELANAEALAVEMDAADIAAAARINMGYAHWIKGDPESARGHYAEGAEIARESNDSPRLRSALLNFAATSREVGRWEEAVIAYDEYLTLDAVEPNDFAAAHIGCGLSSLEMGDFVSAASHFEEAERVAQEAGLDDLRITARIDQGIASERGGRREEAFELYSSAAELARSAGNNELLAVAVASEAYARRPVDYTEADPLFTQAEDLYRLLGQRTELANTLYWHAVMLKDAGIRDRALGTWREEEAIRRDLEQHIDLGDCLLGQASVLREREEWLTLEAMYSQAAAAFERGASAAGLAETRLLQSRLLRIQGRRDEAIEHSDLALTAALDAGLLATECRIRGIRAMLLAELGDPAAARRELDAAESTSMGNGLVEQATWALARRAYVMAHADEAPDEVVLQLKTAAQYAADNERPRLGKRATLRMINEIRVQCSEAYSEPLGELRAALRVEPSAESGARIIDAAVDTDEAATMADSPRDAIPHDEARENESE